MYANKTFSKVVKTLGMEGWGKRIFVYLLVFHQYRTPLLFPVTFSGRYLPDAADRGCFHCSFVAIGPLALILDELKTSLFPKTALQLGCSYSMMMCGNSKCNLLSPFRRRSQTFNLQERVNCILSWTHGNCSARIGLGQLTIYVAWGWPRWIFLAGLT